MKFLFNILLVTLPFTLSADVANNVQNRIKKTGHLISANTITLGQKLKNSGNKIDHKSQAFAKLAANKLRRKKLATKLKVNHAKNIIKAKKNKLLTNLQVQSIKAKYLAKKIAKKSATKCSNALQVTKNKVDNINNNLE